LLGAGMSTVDYLDFATHPHAWDLYFAVAGMMLLLVGRAANIFPLCALLNGCRRLRCNKRAGSRPHSGKARITCRMQVVMWWSGLKGAVSFALAMTLNDDRASRQVVKTCVASLRSLHTSRFTPLDKSSRRASPHLASLDFARLT
jgi:NhaP-type Na+/H+ or K+/H+ antiporter